MSWLQYMCKWGKTLTSLILSFLIRLLGEFSEITITIVLGLSITLFSIYLEAELKVSSSSLASESASWVYAKRVCNLSTYLLGVFNFRSHLSRAVYCPLCIWKLCNWRTDADKTLVWWHLIAFSLIDLFLIVLYWVYATQSHLWLSVFRNRSSD